MALLRLLQTWLVEILFGPWFCIDGLVDAFREREEGHKFFWSLILLAALIGLFAALRAIIKKNKIEHSPKLVKAPSVLLVLLLIVGMIGSLLNLLVIFANGFSMPASPSECRSARLRWLADHIPNNSSRFTLFLFSQPGWYSSPGDFMIAAWFILTWWLLIFLLACWLTALVRRLISSAKN